MGGKLDILYRSIKSSIVIVSIFLSIHKEIRINGISYLKSIAYGGLIMQIVISTN